MAKILKSHLNVKVSSGTKKCTHLFQLVVTLFTFGNIMFIETVLFWIAFTVPRWENGRHAMLPHLTLHLNFEVLLAYCSKINKHRMMRLVNV